MENNKFKVLMYNRNFIDPNYLEKRFQITDLPFIFTKETTIEDLVIEIQKLAKLYKKNYDLEIENLKKCELVDFTLIINFYKEEEKELIITKMKELFEEEGIEWSDDYLNYKDYTAPLEENSKWFYILLGRLIKSEGS